MNHYYQDEAIVFAKTSGEWGEFSNMSGAFPVVVNGIKFRTTEHLYQCLKHSGNPEVQQAIIDATSPVACKHIATDSPCIAEWMEVRVEAMRIVVAYKLAQHREHFRHLFDLTAGRDIVEFSKNDSFWGAVPRPDNALVGRNVLGKIFMAYRTLGVDKIRPDAIPRPYPFKLLDTVL